MATEDSMTDNPGPAATAAAEWWAKAVAAPVFNNGGGDGMAGLLMSMVDATRPDAQPEQRTSFAGILARSVQDNLDRQMKCGSDYRVYFTLGVDYGPDRLLADAAREAGIHTGKFPWKTDMWVYPDFVTVSAGCGAEARLVWASDEWLANRPVCETRKWDSRNNEPDYEGDPWTCSLPKFHEDAHLYDSPLALCARCGQPDNWYHRADERDHDPNFHEFVHAEVTA